MALERRVIRFRETPSTIFVLEREGVFDDRRSARGSSQNMNNINRTTGGGVRTHGTLTRTTVFEANGIYVIILYI